MGDSGGASVGGAVAEPPSVRGSGTAAPLITCQDRRIGEAGMGETDRRIGEAERFKSAIAYLVSASRLRRAAA